jgi:hypothetical protein
MQPWTSGYLLSVVSPGIVGVLGPFCTHIWWLVRPLDSKPPHNNNNNHNNTLAPRGPRHALSLWFYSGGVVMCCIGTYTRATGRLSRTPLSLDSRESYRSDRSRASSREAREKNLEDTAALARATVHPHLK